MVGTSKQTRKAAPVGQKTLLSFFTPTVTTTQNKVDKTITTESLAVRDSMVLDDIGATIKEASMPHSEGRSKRTVDYVEPASDGEEINEEKDAGPQPPRQRRRVQHIEESDDEFAPPSGGDSDSDDGQVPDLSDDEKEAKPNQGAKTDSARSRPKAPMTPLQKQFQNISFTSPTRPETNETRSNFLSSLSTKEEQRKERSQKFTEKNDVRYSWLSDVRDINKNPIGSPDYDPRTLYIPQSAWNKFTAFEKQYWEVKSKHWDTVTFFKKGKFYELYEKDADIGHKDFDLKLTDRVNMRMVGVPEMSFDYWAAQFIAKGHKVGRVDQMETAIGKTMRERTDTAKADKIIRRELTSILTAGTLVDAGLLTDDMSTYCMSIKETCANEGACPEFGICFVDTATAEFNLVTFKDDVNRTKFETLIMQLKPRELVMEKGRLSRSTLSILKNVLSQPIWNALAPDSEFWDALTTGDEIRIHSYFGSGSDMDTDGSDATENWPDALRIALQQPLLMSALGGMVSYLRTLKLDKELLSAGNIRFYDPIRNSTSLVLDGQTLANLEIFQNSQDGSTEGTVFKLLANSITPFGKRLFKQWLCHPLRQAKDIHDRLDAVEDFMGLAEVRDKISHDLVSLPDLERLIARIHSTRCKVKEFLATLEGFEATRNLMLWLSNHKNLFKAKLIHQLIDGFPDLSEPLDYFRQAFITADVDIDYQKIKTMIPKKGVNEKWDALNGQILEAENAFDKELMQIKKDLKCSRLVFRNLGKEIYQIEVPKDVKVPRDWIQLSATAKVSRYWNGTIRTMVTNYKELLETKNGFIKNFTSEVYAQFDEHYTLWLKAVQTTANLDAILGLSKGSANLGEPACRPEFIEQEKSLIDIQELRHPCVVPGAGTDFIPNDTRLGGNDPSILVLTGPNMGGKSTLLRQTCVAVIMAHLGCYVPAQSCRLTPCDRIFTRIGANDNILAGQSTFMVELAETSKILHEATPRSMVILDELGRGTSTFDGYSIAYAVLHYLATHIGCLAMFSTHYQTLCHEFERNPEIINMHMGYLFEEGNVAFLYKLVPGICEKSFGMNVAKMASVPDDVVALADKVAADFETTHRLKDTSFKHSQWSPSVLADLAYLLKRDRHDDIGDRATDLMTLQGQQERETHVLRRILRGLTSGGAP